MQQTLTIPTDTIPVIRLASIDILRALTMILMIFVNDLWSLKDIPVWLEHVSWEADGMGLADTVFPAFLFIVGMSIPFAINNRREKGGNLQKLTWHILSRSLALLVMGVFLVNGESIYEEGTGMSRVVWNSLSCISFILIWNFYPKALTPWKTRGLQALGIVTLLTLSFLYRGGDADNLQTFATHWWGILGLIGWAYLAAALIYTFSNGNRYILFAAWILFLFADAASQTDMFTGLNILEIILGPLGGGALPALVLGGVLTSMIFSYYRKQQADQKLMIILFALSAVLLAAGFYTRTFWGISKLRATPAWVLICSSLTIIMFISVYWLADLKGKANWFSFIKPAGTDTLLCYLLPYFAYTLVVLAAIGWPEIMLTGVTGLIKAFLFALLCVMVTGWLNKGGVRLKL